MCLSFWEHLQHKVIVTQGWVKWGFPGPRSQGKSLLNKQLSSEYHKCSCRAQTPRYFLPWNISRQASFCVFLITVSFLKIYVFEDLAKPHALRSCLLKATSLLTKVRRSMHLEQRAKNSTQIFPCAELNMLLSSSSLAKTWLSNRWPQWFLTLTFREATSTPAPEFHSFCSLQHRANPTPDSIPGLLTINGSTQGCSRFTPHVSLSTFFVLKSDQNEKNVEVFRTVFWKWIRISRVDSAGWEEVQSLMFLTSLYPKNWALMSHPGSGVTAGPVSSFALIFATKGFRSLSTDSLTHSNP